MVRKHYATGSEKWRGSSFTGFGGLGNRDHSSVPTRITEPHQTKERDSETSSRFVGDPDCIVFASKRRGWGTTGNHESSPLTPFHTRTLMNSLPGKLFMRYKVNVFLKR